MRYIKVFLFTFLLGFNIYSAFPQKNNFTIKGYIEDSASGERLIGVSIIDPLSGTITYSNEYGFFSIRVKPYQKKLFFSLIGYSPFEYEVDLDKGSDSLILISLSSSYLSIDEVVVTSGENTYTSARAGLARLPSAEIEKLPVVFGESDILKAYQLLPGIQSTIEGTAGMVVRGGDPGQNLILLDGVPVYNVNHLFGIFSVFNTDAIKGSTLLKGTFPARYGGFSSAVMDIRMKEGNMKELKGDVSIGLIASKILLEGPIKNDKTSFLVTVRRTYFDIFAYPYFKFILKENGTWNYNFHDINLKLNHTVNISNRVYFSLYTGRDKYGYKEEDVSNVPQTGESTTIRNKEGFHWGNITGTVRWNSQLGNRLFSNTTIIYSQYRFETYNETESTVTGGPHNEHSLFKLNFSSGIKDYGANLDFDYQLGFSHHLRFGGVGTYHTFVPGVNIYDFKDFAGLLEADSINNINTLNNFESAIYFEDEIQINKQITVQAGIRNTIYHTGKTYYSFEPRAFIKYKITERISSEASYAKTSQNIHLLSNSSVGFPTDQWVPITDSIKPIHAQHINLAFFWQMGKSFLFSLEGFYKSLNNVTEYSENADLSKNWQEIVEQGKGTAYGVEMMIRKDIGKTTGWIAYTLSKSVRKFENINYGREYPYRYDRRHDIKVIVMHRFNKKIDVSANWIFSTGHAVTLPLASVPFDGSNYMFIAYNYPSDYYHYDQKNNYRMPSTHRLDISANFHKETKRFSSTFSIGLFNAYMHSNALYYDFYQGKLRSHSLIPILPSIALNIHF
jgi:hypothetical protein